MKINSRDINELNPKVADMCRKFLDKCSKDEYLIKKGVGVIITSTFRNAESQNDLYAQGRTKPGGKVTNAKAGYSMHNFRCAFDFAPTLKVGDKAVIPWNDSALFTYIGQIGKSVGLEWGGDWKSFKDMPHFQFTEGLTLAQLRLKYGTEAKKV